MLPANLESVVIRHVVATDHDAYIALEKNEEVKRYVNGPSKRPPEELKAELRALPASSRLLAVTEPKTDRYIGRCGLLPTQVSGQVEVYCLLEAASWGRGIGEAVVRFLVQLAAHEHKQPVGIVDPRNARSFRMLERLGWQQIGVVSTQGKQYGHLIYSPADA